MKDETTKGAQVFESEGTILRKWKASVDDGVSYDKEVIAIVTRQCSTERFDKTSKVTVREGVLKYLDNLIIAEFGNIKDAFPRRFKDGNNNPAYGRLNNLRNNAVQAAFVAFGLNKPETKAGMDAQPLTDEQKEEGRRLKLRQFGADAVTLCQGDYMKAAALLRDVAAALEAEYNEKSMLADKKAALDKVTQAGGHVATAKAA